MRDALQVLASEGLVDLRGATALVTPLTIEDLQELYELREAVEPVATRLAVPRVGRAAIARMTQLLAVMDDPVTRSRHLGGDQRRLPRRGLHTGRAAPDDRAGRAAAPAHRPLRLLPPRRGRQVRHLQQEHREILAAVRAQDAAGAAELTREHLASSHAVVLDYLLAHEDAVAR